MVATSLSLPLVFDSASSAQGAPRAPEVRASDLGQPESASAPAPGESLSPSLEPHPDPETGPAPESGPEIIRETRIRGGEAAFSPEDNKIRLRFPSRLDSETFARVRAAGFIRAHKQDCFVAPAWTPDREDLAVELCGELGDEDTTLAERAEARAERFETYEEKRRAEAHRAHEAADRIGERFAGGQPILVGHHSERRARKDQERIHANMRKAVSLWQTSEYWERRAAGALAHAKYKELPGVRHRRIKGLEADLRKYTKETDRARAFVKAWSAEGLTLEAARKIANYDHVYMPKPPPPPSALGVPAAPDPLPYSLSAWDVLREDRDGGPWPAAEVAKHAIHAHEVMIAWRQRWIDHVTHRLTYERAMLGESGGLKADKFAIEVGGRIQASHYTTRGHGWAVVTRVTKGAEGRIVSVSTPSGAVPIEKVTDYRAPEEGEAEAVKAALAKPPLVNREWGPKMTDTYRRPSGDQYKDIVPGDGGPCIHMTKAEWARTYKDYRGSRTVAATADHGAYRYRVTAWRAGCRVPVFLTDDKVHELPKPPGGAPEPPKGGRKRKAKAEAVEGGVDASGRGAADAVETGGGTAPAPTALAAPPVREEESAPAGSLAAAIAGDAAPASVLAPVYDEVSARRDLAIHEARIQAHDKRKAKEKEAKPFRAMADALAGRGRPRENGQPAPAVEVVVAPELFPTPRTIADRIASCVGAREGMRILEPSAGTGSLVCACAKRGAHVVAVEVNGRVARALGYSAETSFGDRVQVRTGDFLELGLSDLGTFDGIAMNPPFSAEVEHVTHAIDLLNVGGTLCAVMSAAVTFRKDRKYEALRAQVAAMRGTIEELPEDTFAPQTKVPTVLVTVKR